MTDKPTVFISHIDEEYQLAQTIGGWIETTFREVRSVVGGRGIAKGQQWFDALGKDLHEAEVIIALCSPESIKSNWLFFEAGTAWGRGKLMIPLCHSGMAKDLLPAQFSPFQAMVVDQRLKFADEILDAVGKTFNLQKTRTLDPERAAAELKSSLDTINNAAERVSLFVSIPMRAFAEAGALEQHATLTKPVLAAIDEYLGFERVYFGGRALLDGKTKAREPSLIAARANIPALFKAQRFLMVYPERLATTSLAEIGMAYARKIPSVVFIRSKNDLPFGLRELHQVQGQGGRVNYFEYKKPNDIVETLRDFGDRLFAADG